MFKTNICVRHWEQTHTVGLSHSMNSFILPKAKVTPHPCLVHPITDTPFLPEGGGQEMRQRSTNSRSGVGWEVVWWPKWDQDRTHNLVDVTVLHFLFCFRKLQTVNVG